MEIFFILKKMYMHFEQDLQMHVSSSGNFFSINEATGKSRKKL